MLPTATALAPSSDGRGPGPADGDGCCAPAAPSSIAWIRSEDGCQCSLPVDQVTLRSEPWWAGIHLEETRSEPGALPEGYLAAHLVILNLERPVRAEMSWRGEPSGTSAVTVPPSGITIVPAGLRFATRWLDPVRNVIVAIAPQGPVPLDGDTGVAELRPQLAVDDSFLAYLVLALRELARAACDDPLCSETVRTALSTHVASKYGCARAKHVEARAALPAATFRRIAAHVREHLADSLTLRDLAAFAGMSVYQFSRTFKATTGASPHHYLLERRLERARTLLQGTNLPVGEIAVQCGFAHPSHLTSTFQRVYATTPTRYREARRGR